MKITTEPWKITLAMAFHAISLLFDTCHCHEARCSTSQRLRDTPQEATERPQGVPRGGAKSGTPLGIPLASRRGAYFQKPIFSLQVPSRAPWDPPESAQEPPQGPKGRPKSLPGSPREAPEHQNPCQNFQKPPQKQRQEARATKIMKSHQISQIIDPNQ